MPGESITSRQVAERHEQQVQLATSQQDDQIIDEGPREVAAIFNASLFGLCLWATALGKGYLIFS